MSMHHTLFTVAAALLLFGGWASMEAATKDGKNAAKTIPSNFTQGAGVPEAEISTGTSGEKPSVDRGWLASASLEELMQIQVTSAARKQQSLSEVPAAIYVVTQEDIRRSGASSIPDALRMVPGLHVAQISSSTWAISARGFNGRFANKMLVLMDGRSVYTNLYSGVYWDQGDMMLEDIERIEVIRGPGATMWGANAVNGVINIITRSSEKTQGMLVSLQSGITEPFIAAMRFGGKVGESAHYRVFGRAFSRGPQLDSIRAGKANSNDVWHGSQFGFRADWEANERDSVMMQAVAFRGEADQTMDVDFPLRTQNIIQLDEVGTSGGWGLMRWRREVSAKSEFALQTYFSHDSRHEFIGGGFAQSLDFDFQHRYRFSERHDLMWGAGYRLYLDEILGNNDPASKFRLALTPPASKQSLYTSFVQDEIALIPSVLTLTAGIKLQHNHYTGYDLQPNVRLLWAPTKQTSYWAAVSRAVRTPSRLDVDSRVEFIAPPPAPPGTVIRRLGPPQGESESMVSYEAGLRRQIGSAFSLDVAAFHASYDRLHNSTLLNPFFELSPRPQLVVPSTYVYNGTANHRGVEIASAWSPKSSWKLAANYSYLRPYSTVSSFVDAVNLGKSRFPRHHAQFRSSWDIGNRWTLDASAYHLSALSAIAVPGYLRVDARLSWKATEAMQVDFIGQNLSDARHLEFISEDYVRSSYLRRNVGVKLLWAW